MGDEPVVVKRRQPSILERVRFGQVDGLDVEGACAHVRSERRELDPNINVHRSIEHQNCHEDDITGKPRQSQKTPYWSKECMLEKEVSAAVDRAVPYGEIAIGSLGGVCWVLVYECQRRHQYRETEPGCIHFVSVPKQPAFPDSSAWPEYVKCAMDGDCKHGKI